MNIGVHKSNTHYHGVVTNLLKKEVFNSFVNILTFVLAIDGDYSLDVLQLVILLKIIS